MNVKMRYCPAVFVSPKVVVASPRTRRKVAVAPVMADGVAGGGFSQSSRSTQPQEGWSPDQA